MSYFRQIHRMVWKEYRSIRVLWISILFAGLLIQGLFYISLTSPSDAVIRSNSMLIVSLILPICFFVGYIIQTFSGEKSDRTFSYLLFLPIRPSVIFIGKILFAFVLTILLALPMFFLTTSLFKTIQFLKYDLSFQYGTGLSGVWYTSTTCRLLAAVIFFSLVMKNAQKALIMLIACFIIEPIILNFVQMIRLFGSLGMTRFIIYHYWIYFTPVLMVVNLFLLRPWLRRLTPLEITPPKWKFISHLKKNRFSGKELFHSPLQRSVHRFFWKEWKSVRWLYLLMGVSVVSVLVFYSLFMIICPICISTQNIDIPMKTIYLN